jgi:hypothetical protein
MAGDGANDKSNRAKRNSWLRVAWSRPPVAFHDAQAGTAAPARVTLSVELPLVRRQQGWERRCLSTQSFVTS